MKTLHARHLAKSYKRRRVVQDISLAIRQGSIVGLLGPNGAGKTTSFYMIVGLVRADAGEVAIEHMGMARQCADERQPVIGHAEKAGPGEFRFGIEALRAPLLRLPASAPAEPGLIEIQIHVQIHVMQRTPS